LHKFNSKTFALAAIAILIASMVPLIAPIQPAKAQLATQQPVVGAIPAGITVARQAETRAFLSVKPVIIGVGQELLVNLWINPALPSNNIKIPLGGYVITIAKPDGTKEVKTLDSEPATAANWFTYIPEQVGQYQFKFDFLGTYFPAGRYYNGQIVTNTSGANLEFGGRDNVYNECYYKPSSTKEQNITVQQQMVSSWPLDMPTDYWTRPASMNNRGWWPILGNWPGTGYVGYDYRNWDTLYPGTTKQEQPTADFTPWVQAPNTAHVLWKRIGAVAGLIGGPAGQYGTTSSPGFPSVIYSGRCYQTVTKENGTSYAQCYDLRTGEIYYEIPNGITPSMIAYVNPVANPETIAGEEIASQTWSVELLSLSGSYLRKINQWTGQLTGNYSIAPLSGGVFHNQIGGYVLNIQDLGAAAGSQRYRLINWTTRGTLANLTTSTGTRIISNTTYQRSSLPTFQDYENNMGAVVTDSYGGSYPANGQPFDSLRWQIICTFYKLSTGEVTYNISTSTYPDILYHSGPVIMDHGKVAAMAQGGYFVIFDGFTGKWFRTETTDYPWSSAGFGAYAISSAYGMVFRFAYDGVYAFNWTDGKIVWHYTAPTYANFESPYTDKNGTEVYSFNGDGDIADGKLYISNTEHTPTYPLTRGWGIHCINITDGKLLWKLDNPMSYGAVADGYLAAANSWDGYMYVIGKGKTATSITAPETTVPVGSGMLIKGSVLDMSPAQTGTPCVSKESMSTQMEYLHLSMPHGGLYNNQTITGVPVSLDAVDPNGNAIHIADVTTEGYSGTYGYTWYPTIEGQYTVSATFLGDDSYGSSYATTYATAAAKAATPTPSPTPQPIAGQTPFEVYFAGSTLAIIIAIAVVGFLMLKKRA
jgi:hypothetical protein